MLIRLPVFENHNIRILSINIILSQGAGEEVGYFIPMKRQPATWSPSPSSVASTFWQICIVYDICVHMCIYYIHMYTRVETHTHTNTDTNMEKTI